MWMVRLIVIECSILHVWKRKNNPLPLGLVRRFGGDGEPICGVQRGCGW
jgi:hypothetical protein